MKTTQGYKKNADNHEEEDFEDEGDYNEDGVEDDDHLPRVPPHGAPLSQRPEDQNIDIKSANDHDNLIRIERNSQIFVNRGRAMLSKLGKFQTKIY